MKSNTERMQEYIANSPKTKRKEKIAKFFTYQIDFFYTLTLLGKLALCILGGLLMLAALLFTYCIFPVEHIKDGVIIALFLGYLSVWFYMNLVSWICRRIFNYSFY